jgi:hypothetical protein
MDATGTKKEAAEVANYTITSKNLVRVGVFCDGDDYC